MLADKLATVFITIIGFSAIVTLFGIFFFLVRTVLPLLQSERLEHPIFLGSESEGSVAYYTEAGLPIYLRVRNQQGCLVELHSKKNGGLLFSYEISSTRDGYALKEQNSGIKNSIACLPLANGHVLTLEDQNADTARAHEIVFQFGREFLADSDVLTLNETITHSLKESGFALSENQLYIRTSENAPVARVSAQLVDKTQIAVAKTLQLIQGSGDVEFNFLHTSEGSGLFYTRNLKTETFEDLIYFRTSTNDITGESQTTSQPVNLTLPVQNLADIEVTGSDKIILLLHDGTLLVTEAPQAEPRIDLPNATTRPLQLESIRGGSRFARMYGNEMFVVDDGQGHCHGLDLGRAIRLEQNETQDAIRETTLIAWKRPCDIASPQTARRASNPHKRLLILTAADEIQGMETTVGRSTFRGSVRDFLKNDTHLPSSGTPIIERLAFSDDGESLFATISGQDYLFDVYAPHLEASFTGFFKKILYEGYDEASYSWQSTAGTDDFQPKLSLVPLMWGTLKATFYAMIFAIPLGLLAAIYSSEFLDRNTRNIIKPTVEMMASLPSVVLGFLAAIIIAPWIESHVVSVLIAGLTTPFCLYVFGLLLSSYSARQLSTRGLYASRRLLIWLVSGCVLAFVTLLQVGKLVERTAFGGDVKNFLAGGQGSEGALWAILFLPLVLIGLWGFAGQKLGKKYRLLSFCFAPVLSFGLGVLVAHYSGWRSELFGAYAQRNTLVIAIAMGFAIIPIIYSLSEDALSSVPANLRAGSLACGASVWQTTAKVVLPTAASGIFSAIMIGIGRAVGETMIVVMATGNTAVMGINPFEGLRSLSANIAVELPEAPEGGTHYRILFLSALLLFAFTFILNSAAEFMRARYRQRNKAL